MEQLDAERPRGLTKISLMRGMLKMQKEKVDNLLMLIKENPDLPIVPVVDSQLFADDYDWWLGGWGEAEIEYMLKGADSNNWLFEDRIYLSSDEEVIKIEIAEHFEFIPNMTDKEKEGKTLEAYNELKWTKVIAVRITTP